jgi:hypothetical protein
MELSIVRLNSLTRKLLNHLTVNLESCQINVLHLILFINKGFALMLAQT